jgi:phage repressor protein C with HTH and peptisase S24 domain
MFAIESFASSANSRRVMNDPQFEFKRWLAEKVEQRGMMTKLSEATGIARDKLTRSKELSATDPKKRRQVPIHEIKAIAEFFGEVPPGFEWALPKRSEQAAASRPAANDDAIVAGARVALTHSPQRGGVRDLPVPGIAMGGSEDDGDVRLNGEIQYFIERPAGLIGRKKAFAVVLRNDSMVRSYFPGWPIFVDEDGVRPKAGDDVLIELYPDEDGQPGPAFIKTLVSRGGNEVVVTQLNPEKTIRFPADRVKQILRVIPYVEAMGLSI